MGQISAMTMRAPPPVRPRQGEAQYAIRVKKGGLSVRLGGRSLLLTGMPRSRWSIGSIRQPW